MKMLPRVMTCSPARDAGQNLDLVAVRHAGFDLMRDDGVAVFFRDPDACRIAFIDDGFLRQGEALMAAAVMMVKFAHISGFNNPPGFNTCARIGRRCVFGSTEAATKLIVALKTRSGKAVTRTSTGWADFDERGIAFAHIGDEPDARQIADGEDRIAGALADILAQTQLALQHVTADRRGNREIGVGMAGCDDLRDGLIRLVENAQPRFRGRERDQSGFLIVLGAGEVGLRLLPILQRAALDVEELMRALFGGLQKIDQRRRLGDRGHGRYEIVLGLNEIGGIDLEQGLALFDIIAFTHEEGGDPPGIGWKNRRCRVGVDRDLPVGLALRLEGDFLDGLGLDRRPLLRGELKWRSFSMAFAGFSFENIARNPAGPITRNAITAAPAISRMANCTFRGMPLRGMPKATPEEGGDRISFTSMTVF